MNKEDAKKINDSEFLDKWIGDFWYKAQHSALKDIYDTVYLADELSVTATDIYHMARDEMHDPHTVTEKLRKALSLCKVIEERLYSILAKEEAVILTKEIKDEIDEVDGFFCDDKKPADKGITLFDLSGRKKQGGNE